MGGAEIDLGQAGAGTQVGAALEAGAETRAGSAIGAVVRGGARI